MAISYAHEISVSNTPSAAYQALTSEFDKWWTTSCNPISSVGDTTTFRFGPTYWVMRANNLVPDNCIELECIEAHHLHDGLSSAILNEWEGTKLKWEILELGEITRIRLVHEGLVPSLNCYEICKEGWDYYFVNSLKRYLDTGKGLPYINKS